MLRPGPRQTATRTTHAHVSLLLRLVLHCSRSPDVDPTLSRTLKLWLLNRLRGTAACTIQGSFRCFLARQTLGKRRMASFLLKRRRAARTLQCWGRYLFARRRLRYVAFGNRKCCCSPKRGRAGRVLRGAHGLKDSRCFCFDCLLGARCRSEWCTSTRSSL